MAVFRVQVFYRRGLNEKWTNVYHVDSAGIADAALGFDASATGPLANLLNPTCRIVKYLVSDPAGPGFLEVPKDLVGTAGAGSALLPLFNSAKVKFTTDAPGRPDYKFYKGYIDENGQADGLISGGYLTALQTNLDSMLADGPINFATFVSESGDIWETVVTQEEVQMRQMHRKRKRTAPAP